MPIACYAVLEGDQLWLRGFVGQPDASTLLYAEKRAHKDEAEALGIAVAEDLLAQGAGEILAVLFAQETPVT